MELPPSDPAAEQALHAVIELCDASTGILFELQSTNSPVFRAVSAIGIDLGPPSQIELGSQSLLPRWIRVNASSLPVPDDLGIFDALQPSEQEVLRGLQCQLAIPLLHDAELIAWVSVSGLTVPASRVVRLDERTLEIAARLHASRKNALDLAGTEAVKKSNRLSLAGQMAAGIAHEVRNPLAAVRSMVQLVRSETAPVGDRHRLLDNVVAEVDRVNRVLSGMVSLGHPTASRDEEIDIAAVAADAVNFCQAYARHRGQVIKMTLSESQWVQGDAHELRQVVVNLLLNACQASQGGQTIAVDCASKTGIEGARAILRVSDSGEGMPRHVLDRVFEPFFTTKPEGGGLGLSICRDAVHRHGGALTIASEPRVGTVVSVELPEVAHGTNLSR